MEKYIEINCKTACNRINNSFLPYNWDLNIYRGCGHKCQYCFAIYSHKYMNSESFFDEIYVKKNIVEVFEKQISSRKWKKTVINIGGVTDSYQPAEQHYKFMPEILKLCIKYKIPINISTKSKLILRDFNLFDELSKNVPVYIACTITTLNENVRKLIEPNTATSQERFNVLKEFAKTNVSTAMHIMPIIPEITDSYHNLDLLFRTAKENNVNHAITEILNLRGETKTQFFKFIKNKFAHLHAKISSYYKGNGIYVSSIYEKHLNNMLTKITEKYPLKEKEIIYNDKFDDIEQLYLF